MDAKKDDGLAQAEQGQAATLVVTPVNGTANEGAPYSDQDQSDGALTDNENEVKNHQNIDTDDGGETYNSRGRAMGRIVGTLQVSTTHNSRNAC